MNDPRNPARPFIDPAEFSRLFESQHLAVFRYIYGMHGGPLEEVEDLTAETFTRAWKARRSFSGNPQAGLSWLIRIARNLVIDASRRRKSRPLEAPGANDGEDEAALPAGLPGPEERLLKQQQLRLLADRLGALPQPQQEMLVLRYLLDWPVKDIAAHLDMLENTVSVNIRRALQTLRSSWPEESE